jgi:hypothetical protein
MEIVIYFNIQENSTVHCGVLHDPNILFICFQFNFTKSDNKFPELKMLSVKIAATKILFVPDGNKRK